MKQMQPRFAPCRRNLTISLLSRWRCITRRILKNQQQKAELRGCRLKIETQIEVKQHRLKFLKMSLEYGLYPSQADLESLQEFFPDMNIRKLYEVENYHQKLARILDDQFESEGRLSLLKSRIWKNSEKKSTHR